MRHILAAAAAFAVCGFLGLSAASAETMFVPGGPAQFGTMCQVFTDSDAAYGYVKACPQPARMTHKKSKSISR